jgi:hypothetical protein
MQRAAPKPGERFKALRGTFQDAKTRRLRCLASDHALKICRRADVRRASSAPEGVRATMNWREGDTDGYRQTLIN